MGILAATGLTFSGDAMELGVLAYVLPALQAQRWHISQAAADSVASATFVGMLVGAAPWGMFSDAYGRRTGWLVTTALTAGAGVVSAALPNPLELDAWIWVSSQIWACAGLLGPPW